MQNSEIFTIGPLKLRLRTLLLAASAFLLALLIGGIILATHWPFSQPRITQGFEEAFPVTATFQNFHSTYFPHPGFEADNAAFTRLGLPPGTAPIVTVQHITLQANYLDLFLRPGYVSRMILTGFRVHVPALGSQHPQNTNWHETKSTTRLGELVADNSVLDIDRSDFHDPLHFDIHSLKVSNLSRDNPMSYTVALHIPLPPGDVDAHGRFGPWNSADPGQTSVSGEYTFRNADLSVFKGIGGILSAEDSFQGSLQHIETRGTIDVPDFYVTYTHHPVHVSSEFHAFVNGTNGDVTLDRVSSSWLQTNVLAKGEIVGHPGEHGKTAAIDLSVRDGRIQDVLRLFVRAPKSPLDGTANFSAHVVIPPEPRPFLQRVRLTGDFRVSDARFVKTSTQASVDTLSDRARGEKPKDPQPPPPNPAANSVSNSDANSKAASNTDPNPDPNPDELERVISNLSGHVELRNAIATMSDLSFTVPGASALMHGTYDIHSEAVALHGTLKTEAEFSDLTSGFKSVLLKPFNSLFKRKHAGAEIPVHLLGTYQHPETGLDLPDKKAPAPKANPTPPPSKKGIAYNSRHTHPDRAASAVGYHTPSNFVI